MEQKRLELYTVSMKYIRNLQKKGDDRVFSVSPQIGKATRPFIGIVVIFNEKQYCIPLSSPKAKHETMKNDVDFHRIIDEDGKLIAVLDLNNMIPVREDVLRRIDIKKYAGDDAIMRHYKDLLGNQLNYCRKHQDIIVAKANKLYRLVGKKNISSHLKHL